MQSVKLIKLVEKMGLINCTPEVAIDDIVLTEADINRPALQLAGFYDYFSSQRLQVIGNVENAYLEQQGIEKTIEILGTLMNHNIPGMVFCRSMSVPEEILKLAISKGVPVFKTANKTSSFTAEVIRWLNVELAPSISIHGVLVDVYGEGVLIMGEGGIIDWASHENRTMSTVENVLDFDAAIKVAYEFYKKHPKETLIIVTADHETGGLTLGAGRATINWKALEEQWIESGKKNILDAEANAELNKKCSIGWTTVKHAGGAVPVYAIGVGAEKFNGQIDNTEIMGKILGGNKE